MAKRNDFMEGFLRGLYNSGVGNPEVQKQNEALQQTQNADFTSKMAGQGQIPNALPPDHPIAQKVGGFISQMFGGASSPRLTAANFKADPTGIYQTPEGKLGVGPTPGAKFVGEKGIAPLAEQYRMENKPRANLQGGQITWDAATPEQKRMAESVYRGDVDVSTMGFRERTSMNFLANEYAHQNNLPTYKSYTGKTHGSMAIASTSGKIGDQAKSLNMAMSHLESAHEAYQLIDSTDINLLNKPINVLKKDTNDPNIVKLGIALNALKGELSTTFSGKSGTDQEITSWANYLSEDLTPKQAYAALTEVDDLLRSRQSTLEEQRSSGMVQSPGETPLLSKKASKTRDSLANSPLKPKIPASPAGWEADKEKRYQEWKAKQ